MEQGHHPNWINGAPTLTAPQGFLQAGCPTNSVKALKATPPALISASVLPSKECNSSVLRVSVQQNKTVRQIKENLKDFKARANESDVCICAQCAVLLASPPEPIVMVLVV